MHYTTFIQRCRGTNSLLADELDAEFRRLERALEVRSKALKNIAGGCFDGASNYAIAQFAVSTSVSRGVE